MIKDDTRKFKRTKNAADVQNAVERNSRKRFSLHRSAERCTAGSKRTTERKRMEDRIRDTWILRRFMGN